MNARQKMFASLVATLCGWIAATLCFIGHAWFIWGGLGDVDVVVAWTVPFVFAGWLLAFLPLVLAMDSQHRLFHFPEFVFAGAAVALAAFFLLVGWWAPLWQDTPAYLVHPIVTGAVAGAVYSLRMRKAHPRTG